MSKLIETSRLIPLGRRERAGMRTQMESLPLRTWSRPLIGIYSLLAMPTAIRPSEKPFSAIGTLVTFFLRFNPFFRSHLAPLRDRPQDDLPADGNGEIADVLTGKCMALVASFITFLRATGLDCACSAVGKDLMGSTAFAVDFFR